MAASLPRNIQLKLEQTLAQWRHWRCDPPLDSAPETIRLLGRGVSNFSILVGASKRFVVRIDGINPATNGLNRQAEWRALQAASAAGLAPAPRYFNPDLTSLVCDYLVPDENREPDPGDVATLLREIHRLPARHSRLDLAERILRYEKQLEHAGQALPPVMVRGRAQLQQMLHDINRRAPAAVLCHNDLLQANRIYSGGRLWAIDWEYCAMGSPWYDLAVIIVGDSLDPARASSLLEAYLGTPASAEHWSDLRQYACIYRYLELLWYLAPQGNPLEPALLEQKLTGLDQALISPESW